MENTAEKREAAIRYNDGKQVIELNERGHKELFFNVKFLAAAIDKNHDQESLRYIYCPENTDEMVSTDTKRLHLVQNTDILLPVGFWQILKSTKRDIKLVKVDENLSYPDYKRIITREHPNVWELTISNDKDCLKDSRFSMDVYDLYKKLDMCIKIEYLKDVFTFMNQISVCYTDGTSPVKFTDEAGHRIAVIMPVIINN